MGTSERLAVRLVRAAMQFHARALWNEVAEDDAIAFEIPGHDEPLVACICGQSGTEFGLSLFRNGIAGMDAMFRSDDFEEKMESIDQLILLVSTLGEIPPEARGLLEDARWRGRRDALAPHLIVKRPGARPRTPRAPEIRTMLYAVSAILAAHESATLEACRYDDPSGVPMMRLSGPPHAPKIERARLVQPLPGNASATEPLQFHAPTHRLAPTTWCAGIFTLPAAIEGEEQTVRAMLLAEAETGKVLRCDVVLGEGVGDAAAAIRDYADGHGHKLGAHVPTGFRCTSESMLELLRPAFEQRGSVCIHDPDQPGLREVARGLCEAVADPDRARGMQEDRDDPEWAAWHDGVAGLFATLLRVAQGRNLSWKRAFELYFDTPQRHAPAPEIDEDDPILDSFTSWVLTLYRPQRKSRTILETVLLRRDLPANQRLAAESIGKSVLSLFRVASIDSPWVTLLDLATGELHRVRDRLLSETTDAGLLLPAGLYAAGPFTFMTTLGPPLRAHESAAAFDYLESRGIEFTHSGFAANPHFGGILATWLRERYEEPGGPPILHNSDGERLVALTADFELADANRTVERLCARPDIERDPNDGSYSWFRCEGEDGTEDLRVLRARMEVFDDHLVLECNSEERFAAARAVLESLGGVRLTGVRNVPIDLGAVADGDAPLDDAPGIDEHRRHDALQVDPEVAEQMTAVHRRMMFRAIDQPIPMFEGKTLRESCRTAEGRRRVAFWIRSMPTPHPSMTEEALGRLRDDLLKELGL